MEDFKSAYLKIAAFALSTQLHAAVGWMRETTVEERIAKLTKELNLTPAQESQVQAALRDQEAALMHPPGQESAPTVQGTTEDRILAVLSKEQRERFVRLWYG